MGGALIKILDGVTSVEACRERAHAAHACFDNCDLALNVTACEDVTTYRRSDSKELVHFRIGSRLLQWNRLRCSFWNI